MSHPTWVRGLKQFRDKYDLIASKVAPYVGAWIETLEMNGKPNYKRSHPTWVRGLKHVERCLYGRGRGRTLRGCVD